MICTAFQAIRRMDEILVANFMVFNDVVPEETRYDLCIADEGLGHRLLPAREPQARSAPRFAWLTDFVGLAADAGRWGPAGRLA